jgi:hypothetical protein
MLLGWVDRFARCPYGADDNAPVPGLMAPLHKAVLAALQQLLLEKPPAQEQCWLDVLEVLTAQLCPAAAAAERQRPEEPTPAPQQPPQQQQQQQPQALPQAPPVSQLQALLNQMGGSGSKPPLDKLTEALRALNLASSMQGLGPGSLVLPPPAWAPPAGCRQLTNQWMARLVELLLELYRSHLPRPVKVAPAPAELLPARGAPTRAQIECAPRRQPRVKP